MSSLPVSHLELGSAPEPMAPLTHAVISPANIALEARLQRSKPLTWWQRWKFQWELRGLERRLAKLNQVPDGLQLEFEDLRERLKKLYDVKLWLAQKRQIEPDNAELESLWAKHQALTRPLYSEYQALHQQLHIAERKQLLKAAQHIRQRLEDNPRVIERLKAENESLRIQREEARSYEQLIISRLTQLGYCNRWTDRNGNKKVDEVRFSEVHLTMDAVYFKLAASYRTAFGGWGTRIPYGVKIGDIVSEATLFELSLACQRQISAKYNSTNGAWVIVHRLDTNDGLLNQVKYTDVMARYPHKYHQRMPLCVGVAYHRQVQWLNLVQYPHWLVAGFTGSGKSNFINSIICTLVTQHSPDEVRLLLVDLKDGIEFSSYERLPHLHGDVCESIPALADRLAELEAIMQERNQYMKGKAKSLQEYQAKFPDEVIPRIVCIIDEVASIMAHGDLTKRINNSLRQLTAKGRAPGIHIILSTQRPSVDAIDGGIKVNLAARIVGRMPSHTDSQTVLGTGDAKELSNVPGRMIMQIGPDPIPIQTPMIEDSDVLEAVKRAMQFERPEPLAVPEDAHINEEWTPEKVVALSLTHLGGNISHAAVWGEIKDEGQLSRSQLRGIVEHIWSMDCILFEGRKYRVERGKGKVRRLVELPDSPIGAPSPGGELNDVSDG